MPMLPHARRQRATILRQVRREGVAVTISRNTVDTGRDPLDMSATPTVTTFTGIAAEIPGNPDTYAQLGLIETRSPTLMFVPDDASGDLATAPQLGDTLVWAGRTVSVIAPDPTSPSGTVIAAKIIVQSA